MKLIDIHSHLESSRFKKDLEEVIEKAKKVGVKFIINSGTSPERNRETLELAKKHPIVRASFGIYPVGNFSKDIQAEIDWIRRNKGDCVSIGEIGLDFQEDKPENFDKQRDLFIKMLDLAIEIKKPVVIHSRGAESEALDILEKYAKRGLKVVMHCFCGRKSSIKRGIEAGFYFSVPPVIKRWENFKGLVEIVPLNKLLTETDAPYLAPNAKERNEPSNVLVTIGEIARIKKLTEEEVAKQIWENANNVFDL